MESATILMPPSTGLSGILLSVRPLKDQNMKNVTLCYMTGENPVS